MLLFVLAFLGGVLTILSPCILPVLPFVFARTGQSFLRSTLPMLLGMAITFAAVATLASFGGGWAVQANLYGRYVALAIMAVFGLTLLIPKFSDRLTKPIVALGTKLSRSAEGEGGKEAGILSSAMLGVATGLLWAPCAGPILGLLLTAAALNGATAGTTLLLLAYAGGAATSLAAALLIGGGVFRALKKSLGVGEWVRRVLGVAVLAGVAMIALGLDTGLLTKLSLNGTASLEQSLIDRVSPKPAPQTPQAIATDEATARKLDLPIEGKMPPLNGATAWLNSPPLTAEALRGKVVVVDFWTYSCINCLRSLPYVKAWAEKYKDSGLVVIGVHAPEFAFERDLGNVQRAAKELGVTYPVALDDNYAIWRGFKNEYWPAHYFVDAQGNIRHHHFGEGEYDQSEAVIKTLLAEAGQKVDSAVAAPIADAIAMPGNGSDVKSPETYVGFARTARFASPGGEVKSKQADYKIPTDLPLNGWALGGTWRVEAQQGKALGAHGRIAYRFHARDLHLVLGPGPGGKNVHFRVTIDGAAPGDDHGVDTDADGNGVVTEERLYQLIRNKGDIRDRTFEIEFFDPGVEAFAFTFG